jgi:sugar (pentulose or hexulose) kinase
MSELFLGIDSGTQGSKVLIIDRGKRAIAAEAYVLANLSKTIAANASRNRVGGLRPFPGNQMPCRTAI